jgi:hypothetical protein
MCLKNWDKIECTSNDQVDMQNKKINAQGGKMKLSVLCQIINSWDIRYDLA